MLHKIVFITYILLFGIGAIVALLDEYNKRKKPKKKQRTKEEEDRIFVDNALIIMAKVMAADRANMVCELDIIKQFIKKYDEKHFKERVTFVKEYAFKSKNSVDTTLSDCDPLIAVINEVSNFTRRKWFLEYLFEIAFADGSCRAEEKVFLKRIAEKLDGLDLGTYNFMEKKYEKNVKNFTGTRNTQEFGQYEYQENSNENENKYSSYSTNGYTYSGKYSYQASGESKDDSNNSQEQQRRPLTELEKAYAALDLTEAATDKEIKARRRNLMRLNHPDLVMQKGEAAIRSANLRCQEINKAFELIKATRGMK